MFLTVQYVPICDVRKIFGRPDYNQIVFTYTYLGKAVQKHCTLRPEIRGLVLLTAARMGSDLWLKLLAERSIDMD
jgi:hypothetical protein